MIYFGATVARLSARVYGPTQQSPQHNTIIYTITPAFYVSNEVRAFEAAESSER